MKKLTLLFTAILLLTSYSLTAQVAINTDGSSADASAMLDVKSTTKGLLIPNIALTGTTDGTTITTPAVSLLVYNTATVSDVTPGYYYNSGTTHSPVWTRLAPPAGTATGQMLYWNGTAWITVATGKEGQVLTLVSGVPTWTTTVGLTDVYSPTGKIWMDRNLGASEVATSSTDYLAYGDLYQWGRGADGHQLITWTSSTWGTPVNGTTSTPATDATSTSGTAWYGKFIISNSSPYDWLATQDPTLWQGVSGTNNPCPSGYRLPTAAEWQTELASWSSSNNAAGAFASPLKLTIAGIRSYNSSGSLSYVGTIGNYWSSTVDGTNSRHLGFDSSHAYMTSDYRAYGFSVRCIKD